MLDLPVGRPPLGRRPQRVSGDLLEVHPRESPEAEQDHRVRFARNAGDRSG